MLEGNERGQREMQQAMEKLIPLVRSDEGKRLYNEVQRTNELFHAVASREIRLRKEGKTKEANAVMSTEAVPAFAMLDTAVSTFEAHVAQSKARVDKAQDDEVARGKTLILGLCVAGIVLGLVIAIMILRSVTGSISLMLDLIQQIANKNLSVEDMKITSQDEIGDLAAAMNKMKNNLAR